MNRLEFSKVIGKGGQTISNIRTTCGAQVKGTDIDAENRLVVVTGTLRQVLEAFEMITDLMHAAYCQTVPSEHFSVQMLLEHSKVLYILALCFYSEMLRRKKCSKCNGTLF